jgi:hypothetical protein
VLILGVQGFLILEFSGLFCLQGYYRAARACDGQGDRIKALAYLKNGIEACGDSNTEDLRNYLDQMLREDNFSRMYSSSSSDQ